MDVSTASAPKFTQVRKIVKSLYQLFVLTSFSTLQHDRLRACTHGCCNGWHYIYLQVCMDPDMNLKESLFHVSPGFKDFWSLKETKYLETLV